MNLLTVNFKDDTIDIIRDEKLLSLATKDSGVVKNQELWISISKVCKNLGMNKDQIRTQKDKVKKDDSYFCKDFPLSTNGGDQETLCIPLSKLNGWLFSISHNKVREDIREKLIEYKNECFEVLNDHFMKVPQNKLSLINGKDPQAIIRGLKSQLSQHIKKIELLENNIGTLLEENATMALPAPNDTINALEEKREYFSEMAMNMANKVQRLRAVPKRLRSYMGSLLDFPEVYKSLEIMVLDMENDIKKMEVA